MQKSPNILFLMCDQLRADAIGALGNSIIRTPNMDRLAERGVVFDRAYSPCPVCVPARYTIRTGCEPYHTGYYDNGKPRLAVGQAAQVEARCGPYLARTLGERGYRTFGIGKFHSHPWDEDLGFETHLHSEELYDSIRQRRGDAYARFIEDHHPAFRHIEQLHGERTDMYYMPQMSPLPAELTVEAWAADRAIEAINSADSRPYFGMVSFIGPHPPFAPPIPFNRMYNPDNMPSPIKGDPSVDFMDEQIPWMNYLIWAEEINDPWARILKARYYGEISYIDQCIGRILDSVEARPDADDTLICLFSDHGDHLGDHGAWQKESFFEASARIPFCVSWPNAISQRGVRSELVSLSDLFGIATTAAGSQELRDGTDVLGSLWGEASPRTHLFGLYGEPGTRRFKIMVRDAEWKYIFMANGHREQLFHLPSDPYEVVQLAEPHQEMTETMRGLALAHVQAIPELAAALDGPRLKHFPFQPYDRTRIHQFDGSHGVSDYLIP